MGTHIQGLPNFIRLHPSLYRTRGNFEHLLSEEGKRRLKLLKKFYLLKRQKVGVKQIADILEVSVSTLYRWRNLRSLRDYKKLEPKSRGPINKRKPEWSYSLEQRVLRLRRIYPVWGKAKLRVLLQREGIKTSESTVGRILKKLMDRGTIQTLYQLCKPLQKRRKVIRKHARRKPKDYDVKEPGDLVEIDHMSVSNDTQETIKHFGAKDVISKWNVADVFKRATAKNASEFLDTVLKGMPFQIKAFQVDGGSEFKKEFEEACAQKNIPLYVLPPRSPKLNGDIERNNGTWRYEFYWIQEDLPSQLELLRPKIYEFQQVHNTIRPHQSLHNLTPQEYLHSWNSQKEAKFS